MMCCPEAERSLLGSLLLLGGGSLPPVEARHFFYEAHEKLYVTIESLANEGRGFDVLCVERALMAKTKPGVTEAEARARQEKVMALLNDLLSVAQVSMVKDHARLVVEAWCFRSLKARSLELQDAALRGDVGAAGRCLAAAHEVFGVLERLSGGPALRVVEGEAA